MPKTIHVVSPVAGFGNSLDLTIVTSLLEENGFEVFREEITDRRKTARLKPVAKRILSFKGRYDVNLFLAPFFPEWLPLAQKNVLIPNPEGFPLHLVDRLPQIDLVLAKTRLTKRIFTQLGCRTEFTSFTSRDNFDDQIERDYSKFFHACSSQFKGTKRLLEVWARHPEWPELIAVINHNDTIPADFEASNVQLIRQSLSDEEISRYQNTIGFHICCSEAEGFGHYIMEAMSCQAVTFATNAPPMNELAQASRSVLVDCLKETEEMNLSHRYFFKPESLEEQIERVIDFDRPTVRQIGASARAFFLENDQFFRRRFIEVMESL